MPFMTTVSATKARAALFHLLRRATRGHETLRISYRDRSAVLLPEEDFESLMETATLLATPGFLAGLRKAEEDVRRGRLYTLEEVFGAPKRARRRAAGRRTER
jgi:prevent-host-death family protein